MTRFSIVPQKEVCAIWNVTPDELRCSMVEIGAGKSIRLLKEWRRERGSKAVHELGDHFKNAPIVISLDSRVAYTAILPFKLGLQADPHKDRVDFHGILRELVNRANLEIRLLAAQALGVEELDSVLFDARVMSLKVDGKEAAGWPHVPGKKLEGYLHVMFTSRTVFHELQELLHSRKELFVTEENKAALSLLERHTKGPFRILHADPDLSEFLVMDYRHDPLLRKLPFAWESPLTLMREEWAISETAARKIIYQGLDGNVSKQVEKVLLKAIEISAENMHKVLRKTKFRGSIYFRGRDILPFDLPHSYEGVEVKRFPLAEIWNDLGFEGELDENLASLALPLLEFFYHRGDPAHHRALARQIHWIAP